MLRAKDRYIRVVIIDDNPDILVFVKTLFTINLPPIVKVHTTSHINWEEVVSDWGEVAVVIVDILMPISGILILRQIREMYPKIDRIAWTAAKEIYGKEIESEKLAVVITKPNHKELCSLVLSLIERGPE